MAKTKYNPLDAFKEDPLAALKQATGERPSNGSSQHKGDTVVRPSGRDHEEGPPTSPSGAALSSAPVKPLAQTLKPSRNTVYLYPDDLSKLRQLSGYASTEHGVRANDSMIVRAALSLIEADVRFLHALKEAELSDRRRTKA